MTVKTIFKTLIGTIVAIVVGFIIIEVFNLSITQFMLRQTQKLAVNQAAQLFSQETYKSETKNNKKAKQTVFADIKLGQTSIQGKFYNVQETQNVQAYYNALYGNNTDYKNYFLSEDEDKVPLYGGGKTPINTYPALKNGWYAGNFVTPANFGIPYLDNQFMQKQFKWNIAMLFGQPDKNTQTITGGGVAQSQYTIPNSGTQNGKQYINYSGYRIYVGNNTNTKITSISYRIYDIQDPGDKSEFMKYTNIDPDKLTTLRDNATGGYKGEMSLITQGNKDGMQVYLQNLMIAKIDYTVEIGYEGITPIKNVIEFVQGYRVKGLNSKTPAGQTQEFNEDATDTLTGTVYYWTVA